MGSSSGLNGPNGHSKLKQNMIELESQPLVLTNLPTGIHDLVLTQNRDNTLELDWIRFE